MPARVVLVLHAFDSMESATKVADTIRNRGEINYASDDGNDVTVTVGSITVEDASEATE